MTKKISIFLLVLLLLLLVEPIVFIIKFLFNLIIIPVKAIFAFLGFCINSFFWLIAFIWSAFINFIYMPFNYFLIVLIAMIVGLIFLSKEDSETKKYFVEALASFSIFIFIILMLSGFFA